LTLACGGGGGEGSGPRKAYVLVFATACPSRRVFLLQHNIHQAEASSVMKAVDAALLSAREKSVAASYALDGVVAFDVSLDDRLVPLTVREGKFLCACPCTSLCHRGNTGAPTLLACCTRKGEAPLTL
jgi:hypothetical protein